MSVKPFLFLIAIVFGFGLALSPALFADVTVERSFTTSGVEGMGTLESSEKTSFKNSKKYTESSMKSSSKLMSTFMGKEPATAVIRLDKELIWNINHKKKSFVELPIKKFEQAEPSAQEQEEEIKDEKDWKVVKNEFNVKDTGNKKDINGFPCREYILTWLLELENVNTKERIKNIMTSDMWTTKITDKIKKLQEEEERFNSEYMKKLGLNMTPAEAERFGLNVLGAMSGKVDADLKKEMAKIEGYPILTTVKWERESTAEKAAAAPKEEQSEYEDDKPKDLTEFLKKSVDKLARDTAKEAEKKKERQQAAQRKVMVETRLEIKSIDSSSIEDSMFEVPAGYKKEK